jgi:tRNA(Ile)-lysidine synthase
VEGLMMNFFRGTGLAGLKGMIPKKGKIIRPLLDFSREEILQYAQHHQISWMEDRSNAESKYTRNLFRNELIPQIKKVYPSFQDNVVQNAKRFAEIEMIYQKEMERLKSKLLISSLDGWKIPVNLIRNIVPLDTVLFEIFTSFGFSSAQAFEVKKLFDAETGRFITSATHRVLKNRDWLLIEPITSSSHQLILIHENDIEASFDSHKITLQQAAKSEFDQNKLHAFIDEKGLQYPLILRKWKHGDYFYPLGMKKKKKVSKFMTDLKLSRIEKENQWVIESNKKIIWIVGQRMDERFKVTEQTKSVVVFKLI